MASFFFPLESLRVIGQGICENAGKSVVICILHYPNVFQNSISPKQHVLEKSSLRTEEFMCFTGLDRFSNAREESKA